MTKQCKQCDKLETDLDCLQREHRALERERDEREEERDELKAERDDLLQEVKELEEARDDFKNALQDSDAEVAELRKAEARLIDECAEWEEELLDTEKILKRVRWERDDAQDTIVSLESDIACLQASVDRLEAQEREVANREDLLYALLRQYFQYTCPIAQREIVLAKILEEIQ